MKNRFSYHLLVGTRVIDHSTDLKALKLRAQSILNSDDGEDWEYLKVIGTLVKDDSADMVVVRVFRDGIDEV